MAAQALTLYSLADCIYCHQVRMVIAEKGLEVDIIELEPLDLPEDLIILNPYGSLPTLVDRDLVLYNEQVICAYLDERYPQQMLLPRDPAGKARARLALYRIGNDWYSLYHAMQKQAGEELLQSGKRLQESLLAAGSLFRGETFYPGERFSMADIVLAPLLWRLHKRYGLLPAGPVGEYSERLFARPAFQQSLSEAERQMMPH